MLEQLTWDLYIAVQSYRDKASVVFVSVKQMR